MIHSNLLTGAVHVLDMLALSNVHVTLPFQLTAYQSLQHTRIPHTNAKRSLLSHVSTHLSYSS